MIQILWATIRPNAFLQMHTHWINRAENPENIKTLVSVNTQEDADKLSKYDCIVFEPTTIGVCEPAYMLSTSINPNDDDIIIFASDDFYPPQNWDTYVLDKLKGKTGALFVKDGYQENNSSNMLEPAITIPIMTGGCLKKLNNIIYHPIYVHMFSDIELYNNLKDLDLLIDVRSEDEDIIFKHIHYIDGQRKHDKFDIQYLNNWNNDKSVWEKRKLMSVEERITINIESVSDSDEVLNNIDEKN